MRIETTIETLMRTATLHRLLVTRITRPAQRFRSKEEWGVGVTLYQRRSEGSTHHTAAAAPTLFGSCSGLEGYGDTVPAVRFLFLSALFVLISRYQLTACSPFNTVLRVWYWGSHTLASLPASALAIPA
jgi:hypothetical protein